MSQTLYVVMGSCGEYSDRTEWPVRAFVDELKAQEHVAKADGYAREHALSSSSAIIDQDWSSSRSAAVAANPYDRNMGMDYTGVSYYIMQVDLDDDVRADIAVGVANDAAAGRLRRSIALGGVPIPGAHP